MIHSWRLVYERRGGWALFETLSLLGGANHVAFISVFSSKAHTWFRRKLGILGHRIGHRRANRLADMANISVVIPAHNQGARVRQLVERVVAEIGGRGTEIIVVDDQCTDGSCHGMPRDVLVVRSERFLGFYNSARLGFSLAGGRILVCCHGGCTFPRLGLRHLARQASEYGVVVRPSFTYNPHKPRPSFTRCVVPRPQYSYHSSPLRVPAFALRRELYDRMAPLRRILPLGLSLRVACKAFRIPFITDSKHTWTFPLRPARPPTPPCPRKRLLGTSPSLSVIITAFNEGNEVRRTVESIRANTLGDYEIIVVDDGSTDGSCDGIASGGDTRVLRHRERIGVAYSRDEGSQVARGDIFAYLDGHQRVSHACLNACAELAQRQEAIVWPDVRHLRRACRGSAHGAWFRLSSQPPYITGAWETRRPWGAVSRIGTLRAPGYVMSRHTYDRVRWIRGLRSWGASEAAISLKAFFLDIDILHLCGPTVWHLFKRRHKYAIETDDFWWNHALIARVCFDDRTWARYWWPSRFREHVNGCNREALSAPAILAQHEEFQKRKMRPDREFWRGILHVHEPSPIQR